MIFKNDIFRVTNKFKYFQNEDTKKDITWLVHFYTVITRHLQKKLLKEISNLNQNKSGPWMNIEDFKWNQQLQ